MKVDFGTAKDFMDWDDTSRVFKVHEGAALELYVGSHLICMEIAFFNSTYREEYEDCFTITIVANLTASPKAFVPPEKPV